MNVTTPVVRASSTPASAETAQATCRSHRRRASRLFAALVVAALAAMIDQAVAGCVPPLANPAAAKSSRFSSVSQDKGPMEFFRDQANNPSVRIHAAIVTVPDPVATRLGRSFDLEVAALISAFEVREYVLDGFWLTWPLARPDAKQEDDTRSRNEPSVLAFRKDVWRGCAVDRPGPGCANAPAVEYYVLLLVGEAPTFGIHPQAFAAAARDAAKLESLGDSHRTTTASDDADSRLPGDGKAGSENPSDIPTIVLKVIGPSFSGSMQSLMNALDRAAADPELLGYADKPCPVTIAQGEAQACPRLHAEVLSPSATVSSNVNVTNKQFVHASPNIELSYDPIATDQCMQLRALFAYLRDKIPDGKISILAEESSFGLGAGACWPSNSQPSLLQFPQNIASIRAEHAQLSKAERNGQPTLSLPSKFLELDMTGVELGKDLPPPYQPSLSTRSDELVLHQMLDALTTYRRPDATIIIATDIRDRLFLLNEIKTALPATLPVVLEADNLMVHPDYRQLSRGTIVVGAGDTLVCIDLESNPRREISCRSSGSDQTPPATAPYVPCSTKRIFGREHLRQYFPFATDYAANTFRAVLRVTEPPAEVSDEQQSECPQLLVATLAGFQPIGDLTSIGIPRNAATVGMLLSSENHADLWRFLMPVLGVASFVFVLIASWLWGDRTGIRVLVPLPRHSIHALSAHASNWAQWIFHHTTYWERKEIATSQTAAPDHAHLATVRCFALTLGTISLAGLTAAALRTIEFIGHDGDALSLLHGRDQVAMMAVAAVFGSVIVISGLRLLIWNALCRQLADIKGVPVILAERLRDGGYFRGVLAVTVLLALILASANDTSATTVDPQLLPIALGAIALASGIYFLVQLCFQLMRLQHLSRELARGLPAIQRQEGKADWPTPLALGQSPKSPLNLVLYPEDIDRLRTIDLAGWVAQTVSIVCGKWPFKSEPEDRAFAEWQGYLVAQMKAGASVVRGCAWAALIAPIAALVMLQVYPAPFERLQTIAAIGLMALSFGAVVIATLRLEKDILLGRMFTKDADRVSLGDAFGALLPKLLVVLAVLTSVFAPDLLTSLSSLTKVLGAAH